MRSTLILIVAGLLLGGCVREVGAPEGPKSVLVTFNEAANDDIGEDEPLAFSHDEVPFTIDVEFLGYDDKTLTSLNGKARMRSRPGIMSEPYTIDVVDGKAEGVTVTVKRAFGRTRIWVEDSEGDEASFAAGVTPMIRFADPTIADMQTPIGGDTSPLIKNHVQIRAEDRELIVTHIASDGFYVTDTADPPGSYNSAFVFNFSRPRNVEEGDKLSALDGDIQEYLQFTEISHPSFIVESSGHQVPDPILLSTTEICGGDEVMEPFESAVVRVEGVATRFVDAEDCEDYLNYGQWPVQLLAADCGGQPAEINVVNAYTVPDLHFRDCDDAILPAEREFAWLQGTLRHNHAAEPSWILEIRGCADLPEEDRPEDCEDVSERSKNHYSGPRPVPKKYDRGTPWWVPFEH